MEKTEGLVFNEEKNQKRNGKPKNRKRRILTVDDEIKNFKAELTQLKKFMVTVDLIGTTPMILHKLSHKAVTEMYDKSAKPGKKEVVRDPKKELEDSTYKISEGIYGLPVMAIKENCQKVDLSNTAKAMIKRCMYVLPQGIDMVDGSPYLVRIEGKREMHDGIVKIGAGMTKVPTFRYRPMWKKWRIKDLKIVYYPEFGIDLNRVLRTLQIAGELFGFGEMRGAKRGDFYGKCKIDLSKKLQLQDVTEIDIYEKMFKVGDK